MAITCDSPFQQMDVPYGNGLEGVLREVIETASQIRGHSGYGHLWPSLSHEADTDLAHNGLKVCIIKTP